MIAAKFLVIKTDSEILPLWRFRNIPLLLPDARTSSSPKGFNQTICAHRSVTAGSVMKRTSSLVRRNTSDAEGSNENTQLRLTTPLRAAENDESISTPTMIGKRKKPEYQPGRFKAVSRLVMAMNRFKGTSYPDRLTCMFMLQASSSASKACMCYIARLGEGRRHCCTPGSSA